MDVEDVALADMPTPPSDEPKVEDADDVPLSQVAGTKRRKKAADNKTTKRAKDTKKTTKRVKVTKKTIKKEEPSGSPASQSDEKNVKDEEKDEYKWWEDEKFGEGDERWQSLEHNGVLFPPPYQRLPDYVRLYYDGKPVTLSAEAEEVAGFYAALLALDHAKNPVFNKNFFEDFVKVIHDTAGSDVAIEEFEKCDFSKMHAYFEKLREEKKTMSKAEKLRIKKEKEELEQPFRTCLLNGRPENVGNFRVEPPGLFRGRGAHPKTGKLKTRVYPEDITLNLSADAPIPPAPEGHKWGAIRHDKSVVWLAMWRENIADAFKYVKLAANSSIKGISDMKKFETARQLKDHIDKIRQDYQKLLKDQFMQNRQLATAVYLIDVFALRAGGEKGDDEADTVGCCSLRYEHITLKPPNTVIFDFLGKDSIRFYQEVEVDRQVFKNLRIFKKEPKGPGDDLFDRITPSTLNKHFQSYMKGLTAKVFRTYNASKTMQDQMDLIENTGTVAEKVLKYNAANRTVAILCNHQRTVAKTHLQAVAKIGQRIKELEWQMIRAKRLMLALEPGLEDKEPDFFSGLDALSKEELREVIGQHFEKSKESAEKKHARDNEKRALENEEPLPEEKLKETIERLALRRDDYLEEVETGQYETNLSVAKYRSQAETLQKRIMQTTVQLKDKEDNSEVSLGTSKMNYIDPRLTVTFSKKFGVPIEKLFTKTLRDKFNWAIESTDENWRF